MISAQHKQGFHHDENAYVVFLERIKENFDRYKGSLFTTDSKDLWSSFLGAFPEEVRQIYNCHACRHFVEQFGGLVSISAGGKTTPVMWPDNVPALYENPVQAAKQIVEKAKVTGVFFSKDSVWGTPVTGVWNHMSVIPATSQVFKHDFRTPFQAMAEKKEDMQSLINGLTEFPVTAVEEAIKLLKTDSLYRSEKCLGVAEWLKKVHDKRSSTKNSTLRSNITWLAVATAPAGFCHVKSSMIGTLLEDIVAGLPFSEISRRFAEKMHPLQYQRPSAPPSSGNIEQAEKIVERLGITKSLTRRFARIEDLKLMWSPKKVQQEESKADGIFSHLKPKAKTEAQSVSVPPITMTWKKFSETVLPDAFTMEMLIPSCADSFAALITACDAEAPPILQWDNAAERNPVSWYFYANGSLATQWGLSPGEYCNVTGICLSPVMWAETRMTNHEKKAFIILEGAKDKNNSSLGLFPEILKSELHTVRSTIEAYSNSRKLDGHEEASACGLGIEEGKKLDVLLKVVSAIGVVEYKIDRWD